MKKNTDLEKPKTQTTPRLPEGNKAESVEFSRPAADVKKVNPLAAGVTEVSHPAAEVKKASPLAAGVNQVSHPVADVKEVSPPVADVKKVSPPVSDVKKVSPFAADVKEVSPPEADVKEVSPPAADRKEVSPSAADRKDVSPPAADVKDLSLPAARVREVSSPTSGVKELLAETGEHLQERLHEVADSAVEGVAKCADTYVQRGSDRVREIQQTGHEAARKLSPQQPELLTHTIDYLADRVGGIADYLGERDAQEIIEDTRRLLRDHPVPTLGAFAILGIAAGRFLLAGSKTSEK